MGRHICKQPNGRYSIYSTIIDEFLIEDITKEEWINIQVEETTERVKRELEDCFDDLEKYFMTYEEAIKKAIKRNVSFIEKN